MSKQDEFDLRQLIGDDDPEAVVPTISDVPASELTILPIVKEERVSPQVKALADYPGLSKTAPHVEHAHTAPLIPMDTEYPQTPIRTIPLIKDEAGDIDEEYHATFNATIAEVKDLEPEALQALRHRLDRMIRRAKIQQRAIRVTEEGKLSLIDEKRRKTIKDKDTEFMSKRKVVDGEAKPKAPKSPKSDAGLTAAEKQVKQFVKLSMDEATIRTTLAAVGTPVPENLTALIAKFQK